MGIGHRAEASEADGILRAIRVYPPEETGMTQAH
jgi:hypothetical protein